MINDILVATDAAMSEDAGSGGEGEGEDEKPEEIEHILPEDIKPEWISTFLYVMFFANLFVNIDMGILPAGASVIIPQLGLTDS